MGLLDSLFSNDSGGLLDFLRNNALNQQFSSGLPSDQAQYGQPQYSPPMQAIPQAPQRGNQPSPLDSASWPYGPIGAPQRGAQPSPLDSAQWPYGPNGAPSQANAQMPPQQPMQGQFPQGLPAQNQPQAPQGLPPALGGQPQGGFFDSLNTGLQSLGNGGSIIGALTGNRTDPQSLAQQNLRAEYEATRRALIENDVPERQASSTAMLAVMNKDAGKVVLPELLSNKQKYGVISEDPLEGKKYGFIDERAHTINDRPIDSTGASSGGQPQGLNATIDRIASMRTAGATREELLKQIPTAYRDDVEALVTGKAIPANMGRAQIRGTLNILAHAVDKNYDEQMIPARVQMRKDFAGEGKNGQAIGAFNTVQEHIEKASNALDRLQKFQSQYPTINSISDWTRTSLNSNPEARDAMKEYRDSMNAVDHEIGNAYNNGGHLSDADRQTWQRLMDFNASPDVLQRGLADYVHLLNGKRNSLNTMYQSTFGENAPTINKTKNEQITKLVDSRLPGYAKDGGSSGASSKPQSVVQNGHTYMLQSDGSYK
jgi:hypothetical protein